MQCRRRRRGGCYHNLEKSTVIVLSFIPKSTTTLCDVLQVRVRFMNVERTQRSNAVACI